MRISTWNVNGIRAREVQVYDWLRVEKPDVLCLQEIKAHPSQVPVSLGGYDGYWKCWHGEKGYSGVALLVRADCCPVEPQFSSPPFDHEQRIVVAALGSVRVASIYVPNGGKDFVAKVRFLEALEAWAQAQLAAGLTLVLCGDLNVARTPVDVHPELRDDEQLGQTAGERALLEKLLGHGLTDLGRHFAPHDERLYSWWAPWRQYRERNMGWRLDYVLASASAAARAVGCTVARDVGTSDHGPVTATFDGPLFRPDEVQAAPLRAPAPTQPAEDSGPQLDLFGLPVGKR